MAKIHSKQIQVDSFPDGTTLEENSGALRIKDDGVTYAKLQNLATANRVLGSASTGLIGEVQVATAMIADDAVTTVKIADSNVTTAKIADLGVTYDKLAAAAIADDLATAAGSNQVARADAVKTYVDNVAAGMDVKASVVVATTAALPTVTYNNGNGTLTASSAGSLSIDGESLATQNARILVKDQADKVQNGVYILSTVGTGGAPFVLTRATDFNAASEFNGAPFFMVEGGTVNGAHGFVCHIDDPAYFALGSDDIVFHQFSAPGQDSVAGAGIQLDANVLSLDIRADRGLHIVSGELDIELKSESGGSLSVDNQGLYIADGAIGNAKLDNSSISGIALGQHLGDLTVESDLGIRFQSGSEYDGQYARQLELDFQATGTDFEAPSSSPAAGDLGAPDGNGIRTVQLYRSGSALSAELLNSGHPMFGAVSLFRNGVRMGYRSMSALTGSSDPGTWYLHNENTNELHLDIMEGTGGSAEDYDDDEFEISFFVERA